jgi:hypothetical protein
MLTLWHRECKEKRDVRSAESYVAIRTYNSCKIYLGQKKKHCVVVCQVHEVMELGAHYNLRKKCS